MKKTFGNRTILAITFSLLFVISGIGASILIPANAATQQSAAKPLVAAAGPLSQAEANWAYPAGNQFNQAYSPQNQINSSDAQYLGLNWIFPLPDRPPSLITYVGPGGLGVSTAVLIVNGTVFALTQFDQVFAMDAANGGVLWTTQVPLSLNSGQSTGSPLALHAHDGVVQYTTATFGSGVSGPTFWFQGADNRVYALNANTGKQELNFTDFTGPRMVQGNSPTSFYNAVGVDNILIDQSRGIMITSHQAETMSSNGRCFYMGWNLNAKPPVPLWTSYCTPPQPGGGLPVNPNWTVSQVSNMTSAEIFYPGPANGYTTPAEVAGGLFMNTNNNAAVQLKSLSQSQLNATLYNDWGYAEQSAKCEAITAGMSTGSTGAGWGGAWLLGSGPTKGVAFVSTNNKDPYAGPCTPGPDLWSASILALNVTTGQWIWGFQGNAHDLWDYDCTWWQAAANETINNVNTPVILKTCKNGYLYEINALTGHLVWAWTPPSSFISRCPECFMLNPLNKTQMSYEWISQAVGQPANIGAKWLSYGGGFEDTQAYDPALNYIFVVSENFVGLNTYTGLNASTYFTSAGFAFGTLPEQANIYTLTKLANATVFAIDAATGNTVWHYFIPLQGYRGGVTTSGNLVLLATSSGDLIMLNAKNGQLVRDYYIGGPLNVTPSVGATIKGQEEIIFPITAGLVTWASGGVPGDIVALSLQGVAGTTSVATPVGTSITTATVTAPAPASTVTVTTTSGGFDASTVYGLAAIAVIAIIAAGFFAIRGRRPAR